MWLILLSSATHCRHPPGQDWCPEQPSSNVSSVTWGWANTTGEHPWPDDQPEHANPSTSSTTTTASQLSTNMVSLPSMIRLPWRFSHFYWNHNEQIESSGGNLFKWNQVLINIRSINYGKANLILGKTQTSFELISLWFSIPWIFPNCPQTLGPVTNNTFWRKYN